MRAREALEALLADFQEAAPQADVRESYAQEPASRRISRPRVAGRIVTERRAGEVWEAKLGFTLYLPQGQTGETASSLLDRFGERVLARYPLAAVERGPASPEKALGGLSASLSVSLKDGEGKGGKGFTVLLNGRAYSASGWKLSAGETGRPLVAAGEDEPFAYSGGRTYTVELQGLSAGAQALGDGFSAQLAGRPEVYRNCRWKSLSGNGGGVFQSETKTEEE